MSIRQVWKRKPSTPKSSPPSQNDSHPLPPRVYLKSPSPPSYNPLRDQTINQLHNISTILDSHPNPSNAYIHAPPSLPPPQIHPPSHAQVEFHSSFYHCCKRLGAITLAVSRVWKKFSMGCGGSVGAGGCEVGWRRVRGGWGSGDVGEVRVGFAFSCWGGRWGGGRFCEGSCFLRYNLWEGKRRDGLPGVFFFVINVEAIDGVLWNGLLVGVRVLRWNGVLTSVSLVPVVGGYYAVWGSVYKGLKTKQKRFDSGYGCFGNIHVSCHVDATWLPYGDTYLPRGDTYLPRGMSSCERSGGLSIGKPAMWREMAFGGNTRDLGSFGEETDEITDLHQNLEEVFLTEREDGVAGIKQRRRDPSSDGVRT
ncbi:hypothetical protein Tco_0655813 [Tanacetum coccineum]|uniref:Uncharacterized protein n=1 Tax=Tanacetum coccineum TaxID=301880 RepID=A0ABQ4X728_9ASTR